MTMSDFAPAQYAELNNPDPSKTAPAVAADYYSTHAEGFPRFL